MSLGLGACVLSHEPLGPAELGFDVVCEFVLLGSVLDEYSHLAEKIVHCRDSCGHECRVYLSSFDS